MNSKRPIRVLVLVVAFSIVAVAATACGAQSTPTLLTATATPTVPASATGPTGAMPTLQLTEARRAAIADLAHQKGITEQDVSVVSNEQVDWPDSSLGNPQPDMMYAQVVTPGWRLTLTDGGQQYEYHTNMDGSALTYVGSSPLPAGYTPTPQNY